MGSEKCSERFRGIYPPEILGEHDTQPRRSHCFKRRRRNQPVCYLGSCRCAYRGWRPCTENRSEGFVLVGEGHSESARDALVERGAETSDGRWSVGATNVPEKRVAEQKIGAEYEFNSIVQPTQKHDGERRNFVRTPPGWIIRC